MNIIMPQAERPDEIVEVPIDFNDVTVSKNEIEFSLGYSEDKIPSHFEEMIDDILSQLSGRCEISAGYRIVDVKKPVDRYDGLYVGDKFFKMQKIVTGQLRKSEKAALFVCTIGPKMETWARQLMQNGDTVASHIVDTIASEVVERATDILHDRIEQQMRVHGMSVTNRYSPGYCDWSVSEQHLLFSFLPANFCGIKLTESAMMVPIKSISGIIGIGATVRRVDYICDRCGIKDCTYRSFLLARNQRTVHK